MDTSDSTPAAPKEPYRTPAPAPKPIVALRGITKTYWRGKEGVKVLRELDLDVPEGSFEALMGPSNSRKTTLLNHNLLGLDRPTAGTITVAGKELSKLSDGELAKWRSNNIGFIFQAYNLMPVATRRAPTS